MLQFEGRHHEMLEQMYNKINYICQHYLFCLYIRLHVSTATNLIIVSKIYDNTCPPPPREAVVTQDSLRRMIIFWHLTFPQDTQIVTGIVLVVKCQTYNFKLFN